MSTLAQMRSRIADDLNRSDLNTQIDKAINRAIEHYEKQRFWFNEGTWTFTTTTNTETKTFSSASTTDVLETDKVTLTRNSSDIYPLEKKSLSWIRDVNTSGTSSTGNPTAYAIFDDTWYFYPVPNTTYTVTVYGQKSYAVMTADADTNDFTEQAEDLIEAHARWWLYLRVLKDQLNAGIAKVEENEALGALVTKSVNLQSTGKIRPSN